MDFDIRAVAGAEAVAASAVVQTSFIKLAAADWEPNAQQWFLVQSSPEIMAHIVEWHDVPGQAPASHLPSGSVRMHSKPPPGALRRVRSPECLRAMFRAIVSPRPVPPVSRDREASTR